MGDLKASKERFKRVRLLGEGGMGQVFEAVDLRKSIRLALKTLTRHDAASALRFKREFREITRLSHPNLVRLHDLVIDEDEIFYTMELIEGVDVLSYAMPQWWRWPVTGNAAMAIDTTEMVFFDVTEVLEEPAGPVEGIDADRWPICPLETIRPLLGQLVDVLEILHQRGIVHRDLKPANILIEPSGRLKLLDFGVAHFMGDAVKMNESGLIIGTPDFMAPEQLTDGPIGAWTDLYALGALLHLMLTGQRPYPGDAWRRVLAGERLEPPHLDDRLPKPWGQVCAGLLSHDPEHRPTIQELRLALDLPGAPQGPSWLNCGDTFDLIGRTRELARIDAAEALAASGQFCALLISGEAGIGKTALLKAALLKARARGVEALQGHCARRESAAFRAFDDLLDRLAVHLKALDPVALHPLLPLVSAASADFPALVFALDKSAAPTGPASTPEAAAQRLAALLEAIAHDQPLMIALEDLHWADEPSVALLRALIERAPAGVALVMTATDSNVDPSHPLWPLLHPDEGDTAPVDLLALGPLTKTTARRLIEQIVGAPASQAYVEAIHAHTHGNPFFILQLALSPQTCAEPTSPLPSLDALLQTRVDALSPPARVVLEIAAVTGGLTTDLMLRRISGLSPDAFDLAMDELWRERMVRPAFHPNPLCDAATFCANPGLCRARGTSPEWPTSTLYHERIGRFVLDHTSAERLADLHGLVADALQISALDPSCTSSRLHKALYHHLDSVERLTRPHLKPKQGRSL